MRRMGQINAILCNSTLTFTINGTIPIVSHLRNVCEFQDLEFTFNAIPMVNFNLPTSQYKLHAIREHRGTWAVGVGAHRGLYKGALSRVVSMDEAFRAMAIPSAKFKFGASDCASLGSVGYRVLQSTKLQLLMRNNYYYFRRDRGNTPYSPHLKVVVFLLQEPAKLP